MWNETTRRKYARNKGGYASDLTEAEYRLISPLLPPRSSVGRPCKWNHHQILNAIFYMLSGGVQWRLLPRKDFPPASTVRYYFYRWRDAKILEKINNTLVESVRMVNNKDPKATVAIIDSQSVKTTSGGIVGYDAGKKIKGRKRQIVTDSQGYLLHVVVHSAGIQDREGGHELLTNEDLRYRQPFIKVVYADGGYSGAAFRDKVKSKVPIEVMIVKKNAKAHQFVVLPKRWIVEQSFAILGRSRRLSKDYEYTTTSSESWILLASIQRSIRILARAQF